ALADYAYPRGRARPAHGRFFRAARNRAADAGIARPRAPDAGDRHRDGPQAWNGRSHRRPASAGKLDAADLRSSVDAKDRPAVGLTTRTVGWAKPEERSDEGVPTGVFSSTLS